MIIPIRSSCGPLLFFFFDAVAAEVEWLARWRHECATSTLTLIVSKFSSKRGYSHRFSKLSD